MTLYPEVQAKGHAEIDAHIGRQRLPSLSDRGSLPYINAIVKEVLRWNPAVPLGESYVLLFSDYDNTLQDFHTG